MKPAEAFFAGGGAGNRGPDPKDESSESNEELQTVIAEAMSTEYKMTELQDDLIQDDCRRRLAVAARRRAQPPLPSATSKTFGAGCRNRPISSTTPSKTCWPPRPLSRVLGLMAGRRGRSSSSRGHTLIPAVISHDTNVVEHPGVVAARGSPRSSGARTSSPTPIAAMRKGRLSAPPPVDHMGEAADIGRRGALASKRLWP